jgi:hypothetical protein
MGLNSASPRLQSTQFSGKIAIADEGPLPYRDEQESEMGILAEI